MTWRKNKGRGADATGRSMRDAKHVRHYEYMLACPAYRSLHCYARCLLIELHRLYGGQNNGQLFLSVRRAAKLLDASRMSASRAFHELTDHGFIQPRQRGAFTLKARHATTWVLTEFEYAGQLPTKEYMRWAPGNTETHQPPKNKTRAYESDRLARQRDRPEENIINVAQSGPPEGQISQKSPSHGPTEGTQFIYHAGDYPRGGGPQLINNVATTYGKLFTRDYLPISTPSNGVDQSNASARGLAAVES